MSSLKSLQCEDLNSDRLLTESKLRPKIMLNGISNDLPESKLKLKDDPCLYLNKNKLRPETLLAVFSMIFLLCLHMLGLG